MSEARTSLALPPTVQAGPAAADDDRLVTGSLSGPQAAPVDSMLILFAVRLAGGESADLLWSHWAEIRGRFPGMLDGLATTVRPAVSSDGQPRFELLAGRYRNAAEAAALCGRLRAHEIACAVRNLDGVPGGSRA